MESGRLAFPKHTKPLHHQVGGHVCDAQNGKIGFLECGDGTILKPLQNKGRGDREISFYRSVYDPSCCNPVLLELRPLLPSFFGSFTSPDKPNATYMHLEDLAAGLQRPCIMDIKMGARTYDPLAGPEKIAREDAKYPPAKKIGFQIRGMRVYNRETDTFQKFGKEYLRTFNEETIEEAFKIFFSNGYGLRRDVIRDCLHKLQPIVEWFGKQKEMSFYASSILIAYEGAEKSAMENGPRENTSTVPVLQDPSLRSIISENKHKNDLVNEHVEQNASVYEGESSAECGGAIGKCPASMDLVEVCMIDFTHVFPLNGKEKDENYLFGLQNLVRYCQGILLK